MRGFELLNERLLQRNFRPSRLRANEELICAVVEILSESDETFHEMLLAAIRELKSETQSLIEEQRKLNSSRACVEHERDELKERLRDIRTKECLLEEKEKQYNEMLIPETPEGKDLIRRFLIFKEFSEINTVYDNTAFIKGAGMILSGKSESMQDDFDSERLLKELEEKQKPKERRRTL